MRIMRTRTGCVLATALMTLWTGATARAADTTVTLTTLSTFTPAMAGTITVKAAAATPASSPAAATPATDSKSYPFTGPESAALPYAGATIMALGGAWFMLRKRQRA